MLEHAPENVAIAEALVSGTRERRMVRDRILDALALTPTGLVTPLPQCVCGTQNQSAIHWGTPKPKRVIINEGWYNVPLGGA